MGDNVEHKLTRIGIFYDGGFFSKVSDYYRYAHMRKARLCIEGLHRFVRHKVADEERTDPKYCQVVDAHYFRGRFSAGKADQQGRLLTDRQFDDVLMREGVVTHYLPATPERGERGIDVWFALEAFELAVYKRFDVLVLVAGDGDYVPLIRKLNTLGTRVMVLQWDFVGKDETEKPHETHTSLALLEEATYTVPMHSVIDDKAKKNDPLITGLFVP